jgi:hypothetical protein
MARGSKTPAETFAAMGRIRETALVRFDSLFTPEARLWRPHHLRRFHELFVQRLDGGEGSFLEKFRKQLEGADDAVYQLAGEMLYVQQFFTSMTGPDKEDREGADGAELERSAGSRTSMGQGRTRRRHGLQPPEAPYHLAWLDEYLLHWHALRPTGASSLLQDPWRFAEDVRGLDFAKGAHQPMREA